MMGVLGLRQDGLTTGCSTSLLEPRLARGLMAARVADIRTLGARPGSETRCWARSAIFGGAATGVAPGRLMLLAQPQACRG